ncbi:hypothetical protein VTK26DRAFT_1954 [Humicola hyalothermophila]
MKSGWIPKGKSLLGSSTDDPSELTEYPRYRGLSQKDRREYHSVFTEVLHVRGKQKVSSKSPSPCLSLPADPSFHRQDKQKQSANR